MRIGIMDAGHAVWPAGGEVARLQAWSILLAAAGRKAVDVAFMSEDGRPVKLPPVLKDSELRSLQLPAPLVLSRVQHLLRRALGGRSLWTDPRQKRWESWLRRHGIDALICLHPHPWWNPQAVGVCAWIPDFQHKSLPHLFSEREIATRNRAYARVAEQSDIVILSSETVQKEFRTMAPAHKDKARVFSFPSRYAFLDHLAPFDIDPLLSRFGLEQGYFLVVNQFFAHKNHQQLVEALGILRQKGPCPQIVAIGQPVDYRDLSGVYLSQLLSRIAELRVEERFKVLGFVASDVRDALLRSCKAVIQPSRCEGWNTTVEDAKALGRPIIASRIDTHLEQVPNAHGFFDLDDVEGLARLLSCAHRELPAGPSYDREDASLFGARVAATTAGQSLLAIASHAAGIARERRGLNRR